MRRMGSLVLVLVALFCPWTSFASDCGAFGGPTVTGTLLARHISYGAVSNAAHEDDLEFFLTSPVRAGPPSQLEFVNPDYQTAGLVTGLGVKVWLESAPADATSPLRVVCYEVADAGSRPKDFAPISGTPYRFRSITYIMHAACGYNAAVDKTTMTAYWYNTTGQSLSNFFKNCAYGGVVLNQTDNLILEVTVPCSGKTPDGYYTLSDPTVSKCNTSMQYAFTSYADSWAKAQGIDTSKFQQRVNIYPSVCPGFAQGTQGCWQGWCDVWIGGTGSKGNAGLYIHELGHTMGLDHAATPTNDYGDASSPMGWCCGGTKCYSAPQQWQLGWNTAVKSLNALNFPAGVWMNFTLPDVATSKTNMLYLRPTWKNVTYPQFYVSYRSRVAFDVGIPSYFYDQVHIHTYNGSTGVAPIGTRATVQGRIVAGDMWADTWGYGLTVKFIEAATDKSKAIVSVCRRSVMPEQGDVCSDGLDNDCNGLIDSSDPNCIVPASAPCNQNSVCEDGETSLSCPMDCPSMPRCNYDGKCDATFGENTVGCFNDCKPPPSCNNNGVCEPTKGESPTSCRADCPCNSNFVCEAAAGETHTNCAIDCPYCNYNGVCEPALQESYWGCKADCPCNNNTKCELNETYLNCPYDCKCDMDGICDTNESLFSCPNDCKCNYDGTCQKGETVRVCPSDCKCNNNKICELNLNETLISCPTDCKCTINGVCNAGESLAACPEDCKCNFNGICDSATKENTNGCPSDCKCNKNYICEVGETPYSCSTDCKCNNNKTCDLNETFISCPNDCKCNNNGVCDIGETTISCPNDCKCVVNGVCDADETTISCKADCPCNNNGVCEAGESAPSCHDCA